MTWDAVRSAACADSPVIWWQSFAACCPLSQLGVQLLSMPATTACLERMNKAYAIQKSKVRNRLVPERAAKVSMVAYNMKVQKIK